MQRAWWSLLALLLIACGGETSVEEACTDYCHCSQVLPSQQRACQSSCEEALADRQPSDGCLRCVASFACDGQDDEYCSVVCQDQE
jgi:hypothetical protein